tara:strand:- start:852 stop:1043 length:192 start_codon:yes stop_codon:yes gene_type:complete
MTEYCPVCHKTELDCEGLCSTPNCENSEEVFTKRMIEIAKKNAPVLKKKLDEAIDEFVKDCMI